MPDPRRVKVQGDLYHGKVPPGAVYVGRAAPGLPASDYANPFKAGESVDRDSELWPYLAASVPGGTRAIGSLEFTSLRIVSRQFAVDLFSCWFLDQPHLTIRAFEELPGRDLACWCKLPRPGEPDVCHGAWLLGAVNEGMAMASD
jgi:hypothetical protein